MTVALEFERAAKLAKRDELTEAKARDLLGGILDRTETGNTVFGGKVEEHVRGVLDDVMQRAGHGESLRSLSIEEHFRGWISGKEHTATESTLATYSHCVDRFLDFLGDRKHKPLSALSNGDVQRFFDARARMGLAPRTLIQSVKIIGAALNAARRAGLIPTNPAEAVELPKAAGVERGTFIPEEVKLLLDAAEGEWKTVILIGYYTGARLMDCCRMAWDNVDLAAGTLTFTQTKQGKEIQQPVHPSLIQHLNDLAGIDLPQKYIVPGLANTDTKGRNGLSATFKGIMEKAGVSAREVKGMGVRRLSRRSFHSLRHSFTSLLANEGVPEETRMKLTGHSTRAVHRGYTHLELETLRAAMERLPGLD